MIPKYTGDNFMEIANSGIMWLGAAVVLIAVALEAIIFTKKARDAAHLVDLSKEEADQAFRVGMTSAIGPALGVFFVMVGLMGVIGSPLSWMRLSIIGAAPTELAAATMAAKAQGTTLGAPDYNLINYANATWVMALNGGAWIFFSGAFADKLDVIQEKISRGDPSRIQILSVTAIIGAFAYMFLNEIFKAIRDFKDPTGIVVAVSSAVLMILFEKFGEKHPKLKEFNLGLVMILAMVLGMICKKMVFKG